MMDKEVKRILTEYQQTRKERQEKRIAFQKRIQALREGFRSSHFIVGKDIVHPSPEELRQTSQVLHNKEKQIPVTTVYQRNPYQREVQPDDESEKLLKMQEEEQLLLQNKSLKEELVKIQSMEKDRLQTFSHTLKEVRDKYTSELEKLTSLANENKKVVQQKMHKINEQLPKAELKNEDLQNINKSLKNEIAEGNSLMGKYATQIKQEYTLKLQKIQKIYEDSNKKIDDYEKKFNEDEFVENTLKNEEIVKGIEENAKKAEEATQILQDYSELLEGKKEILMQINQNNVMKQQEIEKIQSIEERMKAIMDNIDKDKEMILKENRKMAQELTEIKELLMGKLE